MIFKPLLIVILLCLPATLVQSQVADTSWRRTQIIIDSCFTIHGRLQIANGTPSVRIWMVGTKRYLAVHQTEIDGILSLALPPTLVRFVGSDTFIYGDFRVCPITKYRPGEMQFVCIESASGLVIERIYKDSKGNRTRSVTRVDDLGLMK